jgi:hypothetical protein
MPSLKYKASLIKELIPKALDLAGLATMAIPSIHELKPKTPGKKHKPMSEKAKSLYELVGLGTLAGGVMIDMARHMRKHGSEKSKGVEVEKEHTGTLRDLVERTRAGGDEKKLIKDTLPNVASDHTSEDPKYYTHLKAMEDKYASVAHPKKPRKKREKAESGRDRFKRRAVMALSVPGGVAGAYMGKTLGGMLAPPLMQDMIDQAEDPSREWKTKKMPGSLEDVVDTFDRLHPEEMAGVKVKASDPMGMGRANAYYMPEPGPIMKGVGLRKHHIRESGIRPDTVYLPTKNQSVLSHELGHAVAHKKAPLLHDLAVLGKSPLPLIAGAGLTMSDATEDYAVPVGGGIYSASLLGPEIAADVNAFKALRALHGPEKAISKTNILARALGTYGLAAAGATGGLWAANKVMHKLRHPEERGK